MQRDEIVISSTFASLSINSEKSRCYEEILVAPSGLLEMTYEVCNGNR
jgi:hypothetical protein